SKDTQKLSGSSLQSLFICRTKPPMMCKLVEGSGELITAELSTKAKDFIRRHIHSVWQLELLFLYRNSSRSMTVFEAARALYMEPPALQSGVNSLLNSGILVKEGDQSFKYAPSSGTLADAVDETARVYNEKRTAVINFIYASPMQSFSDAFKLKPDKDS
ncbi:MAG: hypothetical protein ACRD3W_08610, partial [Terriglobales bacterium]